MNLRLLFFSSIVVCVGLKATAQVDTTASVDSLANSIPLFIINDDGGDDNANQVQNVSGLLQSSRMYMLVR